MKLYATLLVSLFIAASMTQGANIASIEAGSSHTILLNGDGRVWACGLNWYISGSPVQIISGTGHGT